MKSLGQSIVFLLISLFVPLTRLVTCIENADAVPKVNLILLLCDGCGQSYFTWTRLMRQVEMGLPNNATLPCDPYQVGSIGTSPAPGPYSHKQSLPSRVILNITDSAAAASAFSCGKKTKNNQIAMISGKPCKTIMEAASEAGYKVGLIVSTSITDASPAAFWAHVEHRSQQEEIASQLIGGLNSSNPRFPDLLFGGGSMFFSPSQRKDGLDLFEKAAQRGFQVVTNRKDLKNDLRLPLLGIFARKGLTVQIDRNITDAEDPSLSELASLALDMLKKETVNSEKGFMVMIEASQTDSMGHDNDAAGLYREMMEYMNVVEIVLQFVKENPNTLVIGVSDHETGILGLGSLTSMKTPFPESEFYVEGLLKARNSFRYLAKILSQYSAGSLKEIREFVSERIFRLGLGLNPLEFLDEIDQLVSLKDSPEIVKIRLGKLIQDRTLVGFSTHVHSAVDVPLYAAGLTSAGIRGYKDNTEIAHIMSQFLHVDLPNSTD